MRPTDAERNYVKTLEAVTIRSIRYSAFHKIHRLRQMFNKGGLTKHRMDSYINKIKCEADTEIDKARRKSARLMAHYRNQGASNERRQSWLHPVSRPLSSLPPDGA